MTTSDQDGERQLTRKQLREIRLTGSTPVITEEDAAAAAQPSTVLPRAADPVEIPPVPEVEISEPDAPLTRRQMRSLEHLRGGSDEQSIDAEAAADEVVAEESAIAEPAEEEPALDKAAGEEPVLAEAVFEEPESDVEPADPGEDALVSEVPVFEPRPAADGVFRFDGSNSTATPVEAEPTADAEELEVITAERPVVGAAFGLGVKPEKPVGALFDDLLDGRSSSGSHHSASTALIFTPSVGAGSLSGPIASTGELLITGTYALPDGIGSHGHAHGTTDGRDIDAVLLDGELAPASSPTPIAASSAISTSKSAGEVIRPPVPDKGNKLMLTLAIVAGGLALALAATLIIAATTGVFG
jgi:hypothetical protein